MIASGGHCHDPWFWFSCQCVVVFFRSYWCNDQDQDPCQVFRPLVKDGRQILENIPANINPWWLHKCTFHHMSLEICELHRQKTQTQGCNCRPHLLFIFSTISKISCKILASPSTRQNVAHEVSAHVFFNSWKLKLGSQKSIACLLSYGVLWLCRTRLDGIVVLQTTQPWHLDRSQRHPTESRTKPFSAAWIQTSSDWAKNCRKWTYTCHRESPFGLIWKWGITITSYYIILHHITSDYIRLHQITSDYIRLHQITSDYIRLHQITSDYIRLH